MHGSDLSCFQAFFMLSFTACTVTSYHLAIKGMPCLKGTLLHSCGICHF